jgi:hypothetical protein
MRVGARPHVLRIARQPLNQTSSCMMGHHLAFSAFSDSAWTNLSVSSGQGKQVLSAGLHYLLTLILWIFCCGDTWRIWCIQPGLWLRGITKTSREFNEEIIHRWTDLNVFTPRANTKTPVTETAKRAALVHKIAYWHGPQTVCLCSHYRYLKYILTLSSHLFCLFIVALPPNVPICQVIVFHYSRLI